MDHAFFNEMRKCSDAEESIMEGDPISYYDFEFEQYSLNKDIVRELILDEIIMHHSKQARKVN